MALITGTVAVTPSDTVNLTKEVQGFVASGAGNVVIVFWDDTTLTIAASANVPVTGYQIKRINSTSTTATGIRGLYVSEP